MQDYSLFIKTDKIDLPEALLWASSPKNGAIDLFVGKVRDNHLGRNVLGITYDIFEPLALKTFNLLCREASEQWGPALKIYMAHFRGYLAVGEVSVAIAVGSPHRDEAFCASRFLIEQLKVRAPIWKKEHYEDGESEWVQGHALCAH